MTIFPTCKTCLICSATVLLVCAAVFCLDNGFTTAGMIEALGGITVENTNSFEGGSRDSRRGLNNSGLNSGGGGYGAGKGFGVDLGVVYQKKKKPVNLLTFKKLCQQKFLDYDYKIGISLIDVGSIRFTKKVNTGQFNQNMTNSLDGFVDSSDIQLITDSDSYNASSSLQKENYSVKLPTALCIQFDYHYNKNWYFNGTFVQGIPERNSVPC